MSGKSLRGTVLNAANVPLLNQVSVRGTNNYIIGSNILSWDETNVYMLSQVAQDFGQPIASGGPEQMQFKCGNSAIGMYDFGLLFSCFVGMSTAYAETGVSLAVQREDTTASGISVVWFGNYGIVYSRQQSLIIPLKSADIQRACRYEDVVIDNFADVRKFALRREQLMLVLSTEKDEYLCAVKIHNGIQRAYPSLFMELRNEDRIDDAGIVTPWDEHSPLGSLISSTISLTDAEATVKKYKESAMLDTVVVREDLMCVPSKRYTDTKELFGSIAYTDKGVIALAINFRNNLFVYQPWFSRAGDEEDSKMSMATDASPKFQEFFNITEECKHIVRYAETVTAVPLTAVQFDVKVFERIKGAFYNMELPRIQFAGAFGKIVIPEPVLVSSLSSNRGEAAYCIVPVGSIGNHVICKEFDGSLHTIEIREGADGGWSPWGPDTAFYDIGGVLNEVC